MAVPEDQTRTFERALLEAQLVKEIAGLKKRSAALRSVVAKLLDSHGHSATSLRRHSRRAAAAATPEAGAVRWRSEWLQ
jgi:hypothetical protein